MAGTKTKEAAGSKRGGARTTLSPQQKAQREFDKGMDLQRRGLEAQGRAFSMLTGQGDGGTTATGGSGGTRS